MSIKKDTWNKNMKQWNIQPNCFTKRFILLHFVKHWLYIMKQSCVFTLYQEIMANQQRKKQILSLIREKWEIHVSELMQFFDVWRSTLWRDLTALVDAWNIQKWKKWVYVVVHSPKDYLEIPFFNRTKKTYNFDFLRNYIPNQTSFFSRNQLHKLHASTKDIGIDTDYYKQNRRLIENILIDLSFASSNLEWNTYSYLETEVLVKYNESAKERQKEETQMIINHKQCIEYLLHHKNELPYSVKTFKEIHTLLWQKWLLRDEYLWVIRTKAVEIWGSVYTPLDNHFQLVEEADFFTRKLTDISDPFEQSLFIITFIPYFQIFMDINKRTSRMMCNLPLFKHNLPLMSLLQAEKQEYITAVLAIYELNDPSLMAELYTNNYLLNMDRYISQY